MTETTGITTVVTPGIGGKLKSIGCTALAFVALTAIAVIIAASVIEPKTARTLLTIVIVIIAIIGAMVLGALAWAAVESILILRAKRRQEQNKAEFNTYETQTGDLHVRELNHRVEWRAASRDPRVYANSHWVPPTPEEVSAFSQWLSIQAKTAAGANIITGQAQARLAAPAIDLLDVLRRTRKVLIVGPEGAGKTSLLYAVIEQRLSVSAVVIIDPHGNAADWPEGCEVVGPGRRYDLIEQRFRDIEYELDRRYKRVAQDAESRSGFAPVTVVIDEWSQLVDNVGNGGEFIRMMLTESRKVNITAFVAGHSERVELLGLKGKGDLKSGFAVVRLYYDQVTHQRRQTIDYSDGNGERAASFTPTGGGIATPAQRLLVPDEVLPPAPEPEPTPEEQLILDMHAEGQSLNAIARAVYGSTGGKQNGLIKDVLDKYPPCTV